MGRFVSTGALVLVLAGLVGYIYYLDRQPADADTAKEKPFAAVKADDIEEVQITASDDATRVKKSGTAWSIVEPVQAEADASELSSITGSLASLEVGRVVDEKPADLKGFGLEPARIDVRFKVKGQAAEHRVLLGDKTATGGDLYAKLADSPRVFLVAAHLESSFNKSTFALRDKAILKVDRQKADGLEVTAGATQLAFTKSGESWAIVKPIAARADYAAVESAIERLSSAQMQGLAEDQNAPPKQYGLDAPTATMTIKTGSSSATLILGKTENAVVFAKDASRPLLFTVAPTLRTDVVKDLGEFRRKDLFDFRSFTATRVEFTRGGATQAFDRSKDKDGKEVWKDAAGKTADSTKIEDLLAKVSGLRASSFETAAHASLKSPVLTVTATFDKGKDVVTFGRAGMDVYASRPDEPGSAKLEAAPLDDAVKALDALK
ncbi:MAG TPA: DUF4340 domain-containing protein [Vicinamibacterales bacterium]|nr:DUF4340 domain-containing protein [Vicinamibacterales bacterium]